MQTDGIQTRAKPVGQKLTHQCFLNKLSLEQCLSFSGGFFYHGHSGFYLALGNLQMTSADHHITFWYLKVEQ